MLSRSPLLSVFVLFIAPAGLLTASPATQEQEFQQVRKIAQRDPKVRAAYEDADHRLESKIIQIDPALALYVRSRRANVNDPTSEVASHNAVEHSSPAPKPFKQPSKPGPKPAVVTTTSGPTHTVAKGETLGSIAAQYGVPVAALKTANHIEDEHKLAIGKVLTIPHHTATTPSAHKSPPPAKTESTWDRVKNAF